MADPKLTEQILGEIGGKASDSPTGEGDAQADGTQAGDVSTGGDTGQIGQGDADPDAAKGDEGEGGEKGKEKPPPYDQDPKWQAARAAEARLDGILKEHDLTYEEVVEALRDHKSLRELLGDYDAEKVIADAQEMAKTRAFWAQKQAEKRESEETPEETITRLKREKREVEDRYVHDSEDRKAREESQRVLKEFDSTMTRFVTSDTDLADVQDLALLVLGVKNPAAEVDPTDRKAVKQVATQNLTQLKQFIAKIEQNAVDKYVAGKSEITPIKKTDAGTGTPNVKHEREPLKPGISLDDASALAKQRAIELITKAGAAG